MARADTRDEIIRIGGELIARGGFGVTGLDKILKKAKVPKGSFYHYFSSKEDFGLAVIDRFGAQLLERARERLSDARLSPLARLEAYFAEGLDRVCDAQCKRGCLLGDLGQELAHQNEAFRRRLARVFDDWKAQIAACLGEAKRVGELPRDLDEVQLADFILSAWEGAILRAKVRHSVEPIEDFVAVLFKRVLAR